MLAAGLAIGGLGLLAGVGLAVASRVFYVYVDPQIIEVEEALPWCQLWRLRTSRLQLGGPGHRCRPVGSQRLRGWRNGRARKGGRNPRR